MDWKIDEDIVVDPNNFDTSLLRAVQKKTGDKFTLKVVNFDDYDDYQFKAALY